MLDPRQAFTNAEHYMALGRAFRERPVARESNVIRFPVERVGQRRR